MNDFSGTAGLFALGVLVLGTFVASLAAIVRLARGERQVPPMHRL